MKVLMINVVCGIRSTGRICTDLATALEEQGHEVKIAYGREGVPEQFQKYAVRIGNDFDVKLHGLKARLLDGAGFGSKRVTEKFIKWVKEYDPDIIHLHNIHGYYINIEVLFRYLQTCGKKIIWTLHDCWSFTGHCVYFDYVNCNKWEKECNHCPQKKEYPARVGPDFSKRNFNIKKDLFSEIPNLILVTPSQWLANLLSYSYMKKYTVRVIYNGVDTSVFRPVKSEIKEKYNCQGKKIVLGVASVWDKRKGLNTFIELADKLNDSYQIVLVGLDKEQKKKLPSKIIAIERTNSIQELVSLYSAAYVFVNPTLEDNYPTTNIEAIACDTPVITYETGGSGESAKIYGLSVPQKNVTQLINAIENIESIERKKINIDCKNVVQKYLKLYMSK
ncbi:glycosyltransferase [Blautia wexlerae]|uniref:glycosyltransferase n=1 Tax=Blautia wexlerae TaxID=418240 RepID=UPI00156EDDC3|nr:glycosyltransferase [Blautia wexlerae]NSE04728.1 glycosyltransferase [Blautia wexlerae]NSF78377.1 glycosyltransferase [Blautia wexlerae]